MVLAISRVHLRTAGEKASAFSESIEFRECPGWEEGGPSALEATPQETDH